MNWKFYEIDQIAHDLVLEFRDRKVLNESHKMRLATAYGLERFWGEHLRLIAKDQDLDRDKGRFWKATWNALCKIMKKAGISIPNDIVDINKTDSIKAMSEKLWASDNPNFGIEHRKVALAILIELCDSLVWWTQRYKK
jgi:hypothetical protein